MGNVFSDLNLDGKTGERGQAHDLVWGPQDVPSTRVKRVQRITAWTGFVVSFCALLATAVWFYIQMQST